MIDIEGKSHADREWCTDIAGKLLPMTWRLAATAFLALACSLAVAQPGFSKGPVIEGYGPVADMPGDAFNLVPGQQYKLLFDSASGQRDSHALNRSLESAARFINMHARAGIDPADLEIEIVTHGGTTWDVLSNQAYQKRFDRDNPNAGLLEALAGAGVVIRQCGQSAAANGIEASELAPAVQMAVSAMTVLVRRQAEGWVLLP
ncbi:MAG: DsrE family protein [Wenzhouxiangellaceae bacterium]|nr:DsrE family protein [Wenzhouxiangellaceae bacterium]